MAKKDKPKASSPKASTPQASTPKASTPKPQKDPKQFLQSFGSKISKKEVQKFETKFPDTPLERVVKYDKKNKDVKLKKGAKKYLRGIGAITPPGTDDTDKSGGGTRPEDDGRGIIGILTDEQIKLADVLGGYDVKVAQIGADATLSSAKVRGEADKYVADAYSGAQKYGAEKELEGTKYASDKESEWRQAVADIEVKGRLDLQPIINSGLEKVADIEAEASRDVADITGKYNVEGIKTRGEFDEKIGRINLAGSMYGLISSAFG